MQSMTSQDSVLYQAYLEQKARYEQAVWLTQSIRREFEQGRHPCPELQQLNEIMVCIGNSDRQIAGMRESAKRLKTNSQFQQLIDELKYIVEHLLGQIGIIEQLASASREKLKPQISAQVRESRMLSAYGQM